MKSGVNKQLLIIFFAVFAAYLPSFSNPFIWDDEQFVYKNVFVQEFDVGKIFTTNSIAGAGESSSYYRPLTNLSLALDYQIWELNTVGYHLTNTLLHALAAMLLYLVLRELKIGKFSSLIIGLIFALHPLQTQTVIYINSRGDSLYALFSFLSILGLLKLLKKQTTELKFYNLKLALSENWWALIAVAGYILAILSKEIALAVIGIWALVVGWFLLSGSGAQDFLKNPRQEIAKFIKNHKKVLAVFASGILIVLGYLLARTALHLPEITNPYPPEDPYGSSVVVRLTTFAKVLFIYAGLIFLPHPLYMERTTSYVLNPLSGWVIAALILAVIFLFLGWRELKNKSRLLIWLGFAWFFCFLIPVSGIIPVNGIVYEHWLYLPLVGFCLAMLGLLRLTNYQKYFSEEKIKYFLGAVFVIYILLIWQQSYIWGDHIRFYEHNLKFASTSRLHNNLAMAYAERGNLDKAIASYQVALEIDSSYPQIYHNIGNAYLEKNELPTAESWYLKAIERDPGFYQSRLQLIRLAVFAGDFEKAYQSIDELENQVAGAGELAATLRKELQILEQSTQPEK